MRGWEIRDRNNAAPGIRRFVEQVTMFLTLVGLTALAVGGVGAGQAVGAFLDRKREEIATLKSLGAEGGSSSSSFFLQVMAIAAGRRHCRAVRRRGAAVSVRGILCGADIPAPAHYAIYPEPLCSPRCSGSSRPPPSRSRRWRARARSRRRSLFRDIVAPASARGRLPYLLAAPAAQLLSSSRSRLRLAPSLLFAAWFLAGALRAG